MKTIANNPAYPVETAETVHVGMSCRAVVAKDCLASLVSRSNTAIWPDDYQILAAIAVGLADALIQELEETRK